MLGKAFTIEKLQESLEDHFELRGVVAGTLTAQAFKAIDLKTNQEVTVWRTRGPLVLSEISRFEERLERLSGIQGVQRILRAGVDASNVGFAVLQQYDWKRIDTRARDIKELEARFESCVRILEAVHEQSVVCGDLCLDSFVMNDRNKVSLFAVLGDVRLESEDEEFNRARYLAFRPPEQAHGGVQSPACDLYALGWIGDGLFACDVEQEGEVKGPPGWLKNILHATATAELRAKGLSASKIRSVIERHEEGVHSPSGDGFALMEVSPEQASQAGSHEESHHSGGRASHEEDKESSRTESESFEERSKASEGFNPGTSGTGSHGGVSGLLEDVSLLFATSWRVPLLMIANVIALGVLFISFVDVRLPTARVEAGAVSLADHREAMQEALQALYASDVSVAHQKLLQQLQEAASPQEREEALLTIFARSRRMGLSRAADVVRGNYNVNRDPSAFGSGGASELMVRIIDPSLGQKGGVEELIKLYEVEPASAAVLAAALALDSGDVEPYRGILARAVEDLVGVLNGGEHSPYALMLLLPDAHDLFSEDLVELSGKIPSTDIGWLLEVLGLKGRSEISTVAQLAWNRRIVEGPHAVFLRELQMSVALSEGMRMSLVSGMLGKLSTTDIKRFSEWYGQGAPRVLEASIITAQDSGVREAAFQALRTKPLSDEYVSQIVEFLDASYGDESAKYGGLVAVVALRETVDAQTANRELGVIQDAPRKRDLLKRLLKGAPPELLVVLLQRYASAMDPLDLVDLLSNPSVEVRKGAVAQLSTVNDIMLLKLISQSYDDEKDPGVRAAYEAKIGVIRDRGKPAL
jgi:hypothetical protein